MLTKKHLKGLLENANIEEVIRLLEGIGMEEDRVLLSARYQSLKKEISAGTINDENSRLERASITKSLLLLIEETGLPKLAPSGDSELDQLRFDKLPEIYM